MRSSNVQKQTLISTQRLEVLGEIRSNIGFCFHYECGSRAIFSSSKHYIRNINLLISSVKNQKLNL